MRKIFLSLTLGAISTLLLGSQGSALSCPGQSQCCLVLDGESHQALELTRPGNHMVLVQASGQCKLRMLAVGGGGQGNGHSGGGSGYIQYMTLSLEDIVIIEAWVGTGSQASTVMFNLDPNTTVTAGSGYPALYGHHHNDGGDGYSGGASSGDWYGGSDGGWGQGSSGGRGTGEDIGEYIFDTWRLSPGAGGDFYIGTGTLFYGGGGGGVMVSGAGPEASQYHGQGYGGGGNSHEYREGLQGVILLEVAED